MRDDYVKRYRVLPNLYKLVQYRWPLGVLAYPLTFLCTDLISELYGRKRANFLVTVGAVFKRLYSVGDGFSQRSTWH